MSENIPDTSPLNSITPNTHSGVKSVVFYSFNDEDALAVLRMLGPARRAGLEVISGVTNRIVDPEAVKRGDLVILQREFSVDYNSYEKIIALARSLKKPVILDLDDLLLRLPEDHPDRIAGNLSPALLPLLQSSIEADLVTVPTARLRDRILPYNPNIEVIPNYLDDSLWQLKPPQVHSDDGAPITIGYMGGHSHSPDLMMVQPALLQLIEKYQHRIRYQFWGIEPPEELAPFSNVDWYPPPSTRYDDFAQYFQQQAVDIVIAPLSDNLFNSCKSPIKFLEFSAIGAPGVYSRIAPYANTIEPGVDGLLASTQDEWVNNLSLLIESADLRTTLVENAQRKIKQSWLLSDHVQDRIRIYSKLFNNFQTRKKVYPPFFELVQSITRQIYEEHLRDYNQKQELHSQLGGKEVDVQYLKNTVSKQEELIQTLTSKISDQDRLIQDLTSKASEQNNLIQDLTSKVTEQNNLFQNLTMKTAELDNTIVSQANKLTDQDEIILSLATQLSVRDDKIHTEESQMVETEQQLQAQNQRLTELENEVLSYATSRSWKLTRPLRKIFKKW